MSRYRTSKASLTNKTSIFGIMGGLGNTRNVNKTSRSTNRLTIPSTPARGLNYMKLNNLLSVNPATSGGVGNHKKTNCSCSKKTPGASGGTSTDPVGDAITDPVGDTITDPVGDTMTDPVGDINVGSTSSETSDVTRDWWQFNNPNIQTYTSGFSADASMNINHALQYQNYIGLKQAQYDLSYNESDKLMVIDYDLSGTIRQAWTQTGSMVNLQPFLAPDTSVGQISVTITNSQNSKNMKSSQVGNNIIMSSTDANWHSQTETTTTTRSRSVGDKYGSRSTATQHSNSTTHGASTSNTVGSGSSARFSSGSQSGTSNV